MNTYKITTDTMEYIKTRFDVLKIGDKTIVRIRYGEIEDFENWIVTFPVDATRCSFLWKRYHIDDVVSYELERLEDTEESGIFVWK